MGMICNTKFNCKTFFQLSLCFQPSFMNFNHNHLKLALNFKHFLMLNSCEFIDNRLLIIDNLLSF